MPIERDLFRFERSFRHRSGSENLIDYIGKPYVLAPTDWDEIYDIDGVRFLLVGEDLLNSQESWAGSPDGKLRLREIVMDSFGKLVPVSAYGCWILESASEWANGQHDATAIGMESTEVGTPVNFGYLTLDYRTLSPTLGKTAGQWLSAWHRVESPCLVDYVAWDVEDAVDRQKRELRKYAISLRVKHNGIAGPWYSLMLPAGLQGGPPAPYKDQGGPIRDPVTSQTLSLPAEEIQLRVVLDSLDPSIPHPASKDDLIGRPPRIRRIKIYYQLPKEELEWHSLSDLLLDAEPPWQAYNQGARIQSSEGLRRIKKCDVVYVDISFTSLLAGAHRERLELVYDGDPGGLQILRGTVRGTLEYSKEKP